MTTRLLLIAEDDEDAIGSWKRDIREFNRNGYGLNFEAIFAKTKLDALKDLERINFDCAVIDLRLPVSVDEMELDKNATGNEVVAMLLERAGIPAVVYSGHVAEAEDFSHLSCIKVIAKTGDGQMTVLKHLASFETLMEAMHVTQKRIAAEAARLFHRAIWPRWDEAWVHLEDANRLGEIVTRQIVSQIAESLGQPSDKHHPEEVYLLPPIADGLGTGDMICMDGKEYVIVTPRCNMARNQCPAHLTLALCAPMEGEWKELRAFLRGSTKQQASAERRIHAFSTQNHAIASHFLPPSGSDGPWLIEFESVVTVPREKVPEMLGGRRRSIAAQFVPNLVQRYAAYLGRIGQPDLDETILLSICKGDPPPADAVSAMPDSQDRA